MVRSNLQCPICTLALSLPPKTSCEHFLNSPFQRWGSKLSNINHTQLRRDGYRSEHLNPLFLALWWFIKSLYSICYYSYSRNGRHFLSGNLDIPHFFYIKPSWLKKKIPFQKWFHFLLFDLYPWCLLSLRWSSSAAVAERTHGIWVKHPCLAKRTHLKTCRSSQQLLTFWLYF